MISLIWWITINTTLLIYPGFDTYLISILLCCYFNTVDSTAGTCLSQKCVKTLCQDSGAHLHCPIAHELRRDLGWPLLMPLPWGTPCLFCTPWADQDLSFGWWEWSSFILHLPHPSGLLDEPGSGTICRGKSVFSPITYSGRSANNHTIQGWAAEQEETEDDSFWSSVSLWMKISSKNCMIMYNEWDDQLRPGLGVTVSNISFPSQSWMQETYLFSYISSTFKLL